MSGLAGTTRTPAARTRSRLSAISLRRGAGVAAIVAGIVIAASPFFLGLAGNANGGERVTDRFRPGLSTQGLHLLDVNFNTLYAMQRQFFGQLLPDARQAAGQTPAQFDAALKRRFPAIAEGREKIPPVVAVVKPRIPALVGIDDEFAKVDSLPFFGLPISSVPWLLLGLGLGVAGVGAFVLARPSRAGIALVAVAGLGLAAVPLAMNAPDKANAAATLDRVGEFPLSPKIAPLALATAHRIDNLMREVNAKFIPQAAAGLHESPAELKAQIAKRYPAVARGLAAWPKIRPQAYFLPTRQVASETDFANLHGLHFRAMPWAVIGPGILMLLIGGLALVRTRREG